MRILYGIIAVILSTEICANAGTVYKTIIKNGTGPIPQPNQTVVVHYTGKLQTGEQFDSSRDRNEPFKFKLGAGEVIRGWDAGVSSMAVGERAELEIAPEDGYGTEGYPPVIPPSATLLFDIELLAIEGVTPMPPQPAFGGVTDLITSSSTSSATGSGQITDGFSTTNMYDTKGFTSAGGLNSGQDFAGAGASSSQSFSPPELSQSGSSSSIGSSSSPGSVPSLGDAFSTSMSGGGSRSTFSNQGSASAMDGIFDMGRGNTNDAIFGATQGSLSPGGRTDMTGFSGVADNSFNSPFGSQTNSRFGDMSLVGSQMSRVDNGGQVTNGRFPDTGIPGFDIASSSASDFNFDSAPGSGGISTSAGGGRSISVTGQRGDLNLSPEFSTPQFGGGSPSIMSADTMLPGRDTGLQQNFGNSMSVQSRDSSRVSNFGMDRGSLGGMGDSRSEIGTGMGRMSGSGSVMGMVGSSSEQMGFGVDRGMRTFGGDMGMGSQGTDMSRSGQQMRGGMTQLRGMGSGVGIIGSDMGGRTGFDSRMTSMSDMTNMGGRITGLGSEIGGTGAEMGSGIGGRMPGMGDMMPTISGGMPVMGRGIPSLGRAISGGVGSMPGTGGMPGMGSGVTGFRGGIPAMRETTPGMGGSMAGMTDSMPGIGGSMTSRTGMMPGMGMPRSDMMGRGAFMGGPRGMGGPGFDRTRMGAGGPSMGPGFGPGRMEMGPGPMIGGPGMRPGPGPMGGPMGPGMIPPFMRRRMPPFIGRGPMGRGMMGFRRRR